MQSPGQGMMKGTRNARLSKQFTVLSLGPRLLTKCSEGSLSRIPRPISGTSKHLHAILSSSAVSKSSDGPAHQTNIQQNNSLYKTFYQDLKTAFESFHAMHPNEKKGIIHLSSRYFELCWTLDGPYEHDTLYGRVEVLHDQFSLTQMMCDDRKVSVVEVGMVYDFPLDGALLYYCNDDDMLYFFPIEGLENESQGSCRHLYKFRRFSEMMDEFPWFILAFVCVELKSFLKRQYFRGIFVWSVYWGTQTCN